MKQIKKNISIMCIIQFLNQINFLSAIAVLYYSELTNSYMLGMSIFSIITLSTAISELPTGIISDRIGRKKTVIMGSTFSVITSIVLLIARDYIGLIIFAVLNGVEKAIFSGNNDAYIFDNVKMLKEENRFIEFIGKLKSMTYLASAFSALVGGVLLFFLSYKVVIIMSIIPKIIQLIMSFYLGEIENKNVKKETILNSIKYPIKEMRRNTLLLYKTCIDGVTNAINEASYQFRATFYEMVWPIWSLGIPSVLSNIGAFLSNWFGNKVVEKFEKKDIITYSGIYSIFSNILGVSINNFVSPFIMISNSIFQCEYIDSEIEQKLYKDEWRASMGSIKSIIGSIIFSILSIILGGLADELGIINSFIIFQLIKIIPLIINRNILQKIEASS